MIQLISPTSGTVKKDSHSSTAMPDDSAKNPQDSPPGSPLDRQLSILDFYMIRRRIASLIVRLALSFIKFITTITISITC